MIKIRNWLLRQQKGIGLLELMLSLAVIGILLIMATRYYLTTVRSQKVNEGVKEVQAIVSAAGDYYNSHGNLTDFTEVNAKGSLPSQYVSGDTVYSPWGTNTITAAVSQGTTSKLTITITTGSDLDASLLANRLGSDATASTNTVTYTVDLASD